MSVDVFYFIASLLSGVISGVIVAIVNHYLTKRKTAAEIAKIEAETEKIRAETRVALKDVEDISATVDYKLNGGSERTIYDSRKGYDPYDFRGVEGRVWNREERKYVGPKGKGSISVEQGLILNIRRPEREGRYEAWLQRYIYNGSEVGHIPKNELIAGKRKLHVSCQAKAVDGEHTLDFVIKDVETENNPAHAEQRITTNNWTPIDLYFQIPPTTTCVFRIYDQGVSQAPSSVQIRNLVIAEKTF